MNRKRLTILRDALIDHAKDPGNLAFHLDSWAATKPEYATTDACDVVRKARLAENFCGTSACAMGIAASIPAFNAAGLRLQWDGSYLEHGKMVESASVTFLPRGQPSWMEEYELDAAVAFFDISEEDAAELFMPSSYTVRERKNPLAVADKITALLNCA